MNSIQVLAIGMLTVMSPLLLATLVATEVLPVSASPAQAQSAEAVAKVAEAITVRIEGATQGSGVLVKREGNRYTVLTAWHVVSGQRAGEELDIYTLDGQRHQLEQSSIKRLGAVDQAVLTFASPLPYTVARVEGAKSVSAGSQIYVCGFPLQTSSVPMRLMRFLKGDVIANATIAIPNGYQLLYSNPTLPGMSGGAVLNAQGSVVAIHGQGETDSKMSEQQGVAVKTGTSQAVPVDYYLVYQNKIVDLSSSPAIGEAIQDNGDHSSQRAIARDVIEPVNRHNTENALAMAVELFRQGSTNEAYLQASALVAYKAGSIQGLIIKSATAVDLGKYDEATRDLDWLFQWAGTRSVDYPSAYTIRGKARLALGKTEAACRDFRNAFVLGDASTNAFIQKYCLK